MSVHRIRAAGAVVLARRGGEPHVLLVHRTAYDDWTIPKGKPLPDELSPVTAIREVREEAGVLAALGQPLTPLRYEISKGREKQVDYWRASPVLQYFRTPDKEVDDVRWFPVARVKQTLSYRDEWPLIEQAMDLTPTTALLLVRHAKAMQRKHWSGDDRTRRLSGRGRRQARELVPLLEAYGVRRLVSSSSVRCTETLTPYGEFAQIPTRRIELFTEEEGTDRPKAVAKETARIVDGLDRPTALCGHRPVLPAMRAGLGLQDRPMLVAEVEVLHRDADGRNVAREVHKPTG